MPRDTNFAFNLSHVRLANKEETGVMNNLSINILASIMTFLPFKEASNLKSINRKWRNATIEHYDRRLSLFLAEVENLKIYNSDALFRKLSFFYESGGLFSPHLHVLDLLLHGESSFVSRYHVDELKKIVKPHKTVRQIITSFCILTDMKVKRRGKANGGVIVEYFQAFQSLMINQNNFLSFLKNINKYAFKTENVQKAMKVISKIESNIKIESIKSINMGVFQVYMWVKACISMHIILNPLNFISSDYVAHNFNHDEIKQVEKMYQCLEHWRKLYAIKLNCSQNNSTLRKIIKHCEDHYLDEETLHFLRIARSGGKVKPISVTRNKQANEKSLIEFFMSFDHFLTTFFTKISPGDQIPPSIDITQTIMKSRNTDISLNSKYVSSMRSRGGMFGYLDVQVLAKHVFFFLDLGDLCKKKLNVNQNWHKAYKTHLNIRIYLLSEETKTREMVNNDIVQAIRAKRAKFYADYEIEPPRQFKNNQKVEEWDDYRKKRAIELLNR